MRWINTQSETRKTPDGLKGFADNDGCTVITAPVVFDAAALTQAQTESRPNGAWAMDFFSKQRLNGKRFWSLMIPDSYTRECCGTHAGKSIQGSDAVELLGRLKAAMGAPEYIRIGNGPEFMSGALDLCACREGVQLHFSQPGKPMDKALIESFAERCRDDWLEQGELSPVYQAGS